MIPISHFLAPDAPPGPATGQCGVCGTSGAGMYPRKDILDISGSNITTLFPHNTPYLCAPCVALWRLPKHWHRGIFATPDATYFPLIADSEHRSAERPLWRDLLRSPERWSQAPCAAVLTTDPKKRVWPHARVCQGDHVLLYLHDPSRGVSGNRRLHWQTLATLLARIEDAYSLGAAKAQIATSLYTPALLKMHGPARLMALEAQLQPARQLPEFLPALIVAQKLEVALDPHHAPSGAAPAAPGADHEPGPRRGRAERQRPEQHDPVPPATDAASPEQYVLF
jgi:hypothetical protein